MRYLIAGNAALLASRTIKKIKSDYVRIEAVGISPIAENATVNIMKEGCPTKYFSLKNGKVRIPLSNLYGAGRYAISFVWQETDPNTQEAVQREAHGNSFQLFAFDNGIGVSPAYTHTTTDIDMMWNGIVQLMEELIPFIEQYKYGNDAV